MFPLTTCGHRGVKSPVAHFLFNNKSGERGGRFGALSKIIIDALRFSYFQLHLSVRAVTDCFVESILGARPVATALWGIDLATWDTRGITCNMASAARRSTLVPHPGPLPALLS